VNVYTKTLPTTQTNNQATNQLMLLDLSLVSFVFFAALARVYLKGFCEGKSLTVSRCNLRFRVQLQHFSIYNLLLAPAMDVAMYLQLLTFFVGWILEGPEIDISDKMDRCEASRETIRSVLSATGVHRITQVLAEAWQVFTAIKISGPNPACLVQSVPPPIAGAAPANEPGDLALVGMISHASILEEEAAVMLDWLDDIQSYAEGKRLPVVLNWIQDLRLVMLATHFSLLHRHA
jgi:hypothetical protein